VRVADELTLTDDQRTRTAMRLISVDKQELVGMVPGQTEAARFAIKDVARIERTEVDGGKTALLVAGIVLGSAAFANHVGNQAASVFATK